MSDLEYIESLQKKLRAAEGGWRYWKSTAQAELKELREDNRRLYKENKKQQERIRVLEQRISQLNTKLVHRGLMDP